MKSEINSKKLHKNINVCLPNRINANKRKANKHNQYKNLHKSYYTNSNNATLSTCIVCENISTGCTSWVLKPPSSNIRKSRANVDGLQDTYTIRFGCMLIIALSNASSQPFRGGSTVITSGRKPCALHHGIIFSACPTTNSAFSI